MVKDYKMAKAKRPQLSQVSYMPKKLLIHPYTNANTHWYCLWRISRVGLGPYPPKLQAEWDITVVGICVYFFIWSHLMKEDNFFLAIEYGHIVFNGDIEYSASSI